MLSILILGWIVYSIYYSVKRGFKLETIVFIGYLLAGVASCILSRLFWRSFSLYIPYSAVTNEDPLYFYPQVHVFKIENSFYKIICFLIFYIILCLIVRFLEVFIKQFLITEGSPYLTIITGIMGFIVASFWSYLLVSALAMIPFSSFQQPLKHSILVNFLIKGPFGWIFNHLWF